jgi:hypothetical protein
MLESGRAAEVLHLGCTQADGGMPPVAAWKPCLPAGGSHFQMRSGDVVSRPPPDLRQGATFRRGSSLERDADLGAWPEEADRLEEKEPVQRIAVPVLPFGRKAGMHVEVAEAV